MIIMIVFLQTQFCGEKTIKCLNKVLKWLIALLRKCCFTSRFNSSLMDHGSTEIGLFQIKCVTFKDFFYLTVHQIMISICYLGF